MNENEYYIGENNRAYVNPTLSRDEQLGFTDRLRETMGQNNAQIAEQTYNLGTAVPSNLGGLSGAEGYFSQRYQTTPLESQVNTLKATAQAKALSDLMSNYEAQMKNRYNQAYRSAKRSSTTGGGEENPLTITTNNGLTDEEYGVNTTNWKDALGRINSTENGQLYYLDASPSANKTPTFIENLTAADDITGVMGRLGTGVNGQRKFVNGVEYIYLDTGQFAPSWYRVGTGVNTGGGW